MIFSELNRICWGAKGVLVTKMHFVGWCRCLGLHLFSSVMGLAGVIVTRQAMYCAVTRSIEMRSCSHRCCGKAISVTYSVCVFVALIN